MLSSNQATLLRRLADSSEPVMVSVIAGWQISGSYAFGENAARNALKRMEDRRLVAGSGVGRSRSYIVTQAGRSALADHALPAGGSRPPLDQDSGPASATRNYIVLEELDPSKIDDERLLEVIHESGRLYVHVETVDARNTEHAIRQAAQSLYDDVDADPVLIPVAERMWQPEKVTIRNRRSITIGA